MFVFTGDLHATNDIRKITMSHNPDIMKNLTENDYLIICGDFGFVWFNKASPFYSEQAWWLKWFEEKPFTTLFVDGNHENFDLLNQYPETEWNGGRVQFINKKVIHLLRGQYYTIDGKTFWTFGGAQSHDKERRREHIDWWAEEEPSYAEMETGWQNLEKHDWQADFIVTHCAPRLIEKNLFQDTYLYPASRIGYFFDDIFKHLKFGHWFCGHYHIDKNIASDFSILYNTLYETKSPD